MRCEKSIPIGGVMRTAGLVVIIFGIVLSTPGPSAAKQTLASSTPAPCAGLYAYGRAMLRAKLVLLNGLRKDGLTSHGADTYSVPEWTAYAEHTEAFQAALKKIT